MIRITQLRLPCGHTPKTLEAKIRKTLRLEKQPVSWSIVRHSLDARKKPQLYDTYTVDVETGLKQKEEISLCRRLKNNTITVPEKSGSSFFPDYPFPSPDQETLRHRPVVVGAGPAGLFCALFLAEHGYAPILIERGRRMEERTADVARFWETGVLDPGSNVQFGEGGAGTFSDGKLNTQINDRTGRAFQVLRIFAEAGAPDSILTEAKPHIGTDRLRTVIPNIRRRIEAAGGEVLFNTVCTGLAFSETDGHPGPETSADALPETDRHPDPVTTADPLTGTDGHPGPETSADALPETDRHPDPETTAVPLTGKDVPPAQEYRRVRRLRGIYIKSTAPAGDRRFLPAQAVVLAIGHSARDTVEELFREGIPMEQKQFAVGFRVAHPQSLIDESQYGISDPVQMASLRLPASLYKLTARASSGRGVYSFCMCPGGFVVNASSEEGRLCVNGMSNEKRDSGYANSAVVITVGEKEFGSSHVLAGMDFQRKLEKKAWELGQGAIPVQRYTELRAAFYGEQLPLSGERDSDPEDPTDPAQSSAGSEKDLFCAGSGCGAEDPREACRPDPRFYGIVREAPLHTLLPEELTADFIEGMDVFGRKIRGFDGPQAVVAGVESRTSSPVRIPRNGELESVGAAGLYPCGEGAGYAGGIMSAAMDGIRIAEAIVRRYNRYRQ